jgi:myo-inositol-1(or 4)-monophosphatase
MTHMPPSELDRMLEVAVDAARQAGSLLVGQQHGGFKVSKKGRINLVTEMDLRAEELIVDTILHHYPDHGILAEEKATRRGRRPITWVIDPLDGTTNYAHGYRFYCVSIAVQIEEAVRLGVVYDPVVDECFTATSGGGSQLNGLPIEVSGEDSLMDSMLATGFSYDLVEIQQNLTLFDRMVLQTRAVRRDGAAALDLCYVACGRFEGFWELSLNPWDVAAGMLLVTEAGGQVTRFDGSLCTIHDREILATNGRVHQQMSQLLIS